MKLAMQIPIYHWEDFTPLTDFDFALTREVNLNKEYRRLFREQSDKGREVWLDNSYCELGYALPPDKILRAADYINPTHIASYESSDPDENVREHIKFKELLARKGYPQKLIGIWRGETRHLKILQDLCDIVALPYDEPRQFYITPDTSKNFHYFGFRNLDEIYRLTPASIDTDVPIVASLLGIDLTTRQRRPKGLPKYNSKLKLTAEQYLLAKKNILALKAAGELNGR